MRSQETLRGVSNSKCLLRIKVFSCRTELLKLATSYFISQRKSIRIISKFIVYGILILLTAKKYTIHLIKMIGKYFKIKI